MTDQQWMQSFSPNAKVASASDQAVTLPMARTDDLLCFMPDSFRLHLRRLHLLSATRP